MLEAVTETICQIDDHHCQEVLLSLIAQPKSNVKNDSRSHDPTPFSQTVIVPGECQNDVEKVLAIIRMDKHARNESHSRLKRQSYRYQTRQERINRDNEIRNRQTAGNWKREVIKYGVSILFGGQVAYAPSPYRRACYSNGYCYCYCPTSSCSGSSC